MSFVNGLVGNGFASRYRLQSRAGFFKGPLCRCKTTTPSSLSLTSNRPLCQCVYVYVYIVNPDIQIINRCSHTSIHTYIHTHIYIHTYIYLHTYIHTHILIYLFISDHRDRDIRAGSPGSSSADYDIHIRFMVQMRFTVVIITDVII